LPKPSEEELNRVLEANEMMLEENRGVKVLANIYTKKGFEQGIVQTAMNMLRRGRDIQEIAEDTGLSVAKIATLQEELLAQSS
jgi:DNA-binding phage protein